MANLYISDLHLGHANIIKMDNRPFSDVDEMNQKIIENWNNKVKPGDHVFILGDFCWGKEEDWLGFLKQMKGSKTLIRGNHDLKQYSSKLKRHFQDIKDYKVIKDNGRNVILCHYPIPFHKSDYNPNFYMLYGHVHKTREYDAMKMIRKWATITCENSGDCRGNYINVGCMLPWMNYMPRTLDEIIENETELGNKDERIDSVADKVLKKYLPAFKELAK